jgi:hypothetical protein
MKKMAELICFVVGMFLTIYFLFDFNSGPILSENVASWYYYYSGSSRFGLALGASLISLGFLLRRWHIL